MTGFLLQELRRKGLPPERLVVGVSYSVEHLLNKHERISWDSYCIFMANAARVWSADELVAIGRGLVNSPWTRPFTLIARLLFSVMGIYEWVTRLDSDGPGQLISCLRGSIRYLGPYQLEIDLILEPGYPVCRPLNALMKGGMLAVPNLLGLPDASVQMAELPNGARYTALVPPDNRLLTRLRQLVTRPLVWQKARHELVEAYQLLHLRYIQLQHEIDERKRAELLQSAVYRIATIANDPDIGLEELYRSIHEVVGELMYAENFFIAFYDPQADLLDFPYFIDEYDTYKGPFKPEKSLTYYVIQTGEALLINEEQHDELIRQGKVALLGAPSLIWLSVPLKSKAGTFGAMVVQHYTDINAYGQQEKQLLSFVSGQVAAAIERKRSEDALRESEQRFRQLAENIDEVFWLLSPDGTRVYYVNPAYTRVTGRSCESLYTNPASWLKALHVEDRRQIVKEFRERGPGIRRDSQEREVRVVRPDGSVRWVWIRSHPVQDDDGGVLFQVGVAVDVTERQAAEMALREREEALRLAQKRESLGVLAGGVAHDFNNLLVAMLGQTSLALAKMPPDSPGWPHVEKAVMAAQRAADLTRQMLAYSGRGHFEFRPLDLNALVQDNLPLLEATIPKHVRLCSALTAPLPDIEADAGQMQQVVMNLILNAAEAIGEQPGTVTVATKSWTVTEAASHFWRYTGDPLRVGPYVLLEVEDDGSGMDAQTLARIFDPFFTTKFTGRGLGLAAVLGIVRGHQGGLRVTSTPGKGTVFQLLFPLALATEEPAALREGADGAAEAPVKIPAEVAAGGQDRVVLVIDDEQPVREAVTDILELEEVPVICAADGAQGVALYRQYAARISLVLLDLSMPGLSGEETLHQLQQINPEVRVVLSSGYSQAEISPRFDGEGLAGFIQKPYDVATLVSEVRRALYLTR